MLAQEYIIRRYINEGYLDNKGRIVMSLVEVKKSRSKDIVAEYIKQIVNLNEYYELYTRRNENKPWKLKSTNISTERY